MIATVNTHPLDSRAELLTFHGIVTVASRGRTNWINLLSTTLRQTSLRVSAAEVVILGLFKLWISTATTQKKQ
ncbi:hypothetical protein AOLI_G00051160 [Acnodon oligacanthus]